MSNESVRHQKATGDRGKFGELPKGSNAVKLSGNSFGDVHVLPSIPEEWFTDENQHAIRQIEDLGMDMSKLTVFEYHADRLGEWQASMPLPTGNYLTFTKHRESQFAVDVKRHPTDAPFQNVGAVEGRDGAFRGIVEEVLQADAVLTRVRKEFPFVKAGFGRRPDGKPLRLFFTIADGDAYVACRLVRPGPAAYSVWEAEDNGFARLAAVTGERAVTVRDRLESITGGLQTDRLEHPAE